jgi:2-oxoglutarate ferredoxin oxidoreductase subunit alpha
VAVVAASTPSDCFDATIEAFRIAVTTMCPVILLTDGYIGNGSEPWKLPDVDSLPQIPVHFRTDPENFQAYRRDPDTLVREWVRPGTPGLEHRIGGIEKQDGTGNVNYEAENHEKMCRIHLRRDPQRRRLRALPRPPDRPRTLPPPQPDAEEHGRGAQAL